MLPIEVDNKEISRAGLGSSDYDRIVYAKDQPEYIPLPVVRIRGDYGQVVSRWRLSWRERLRVLWRGDVYLSQLTFKSGLQPIKPTTDFSEAFE